MSSMDNSPIAMVIVEVGQLTGKFRHTVVVVVLEILDLDPAVFKIFR